MNTRINFNRNIENTSGIEGFISHMISNLQADQFMIQADVMEESTKFMYSIFSSDNPDIPQSFARITSSSYFIKKVIVEFMAGISEFQPKPINVAFSVSSAKVSAWVEIGEGQEELEDSIYLLEAKINAMYEAHSFGILVTIVEDSDRIPVPPRYEILPSEIMN